MKVVLYWFIHLCIPRGKIAVLLLRLRKHSQAVCFVMLPNFNVLFFLTQISSLAVGKEGNDVSIMQKLSVYSHPHPQEINTLIDQGELSQNKRNSSQYLKSLIN